MNDNDLNELRGIAARRPLSPSEQEALEAHLLLHPGEQEDWEADLALRQAFEDMPDVPISSNFTAQVLRAVERETMQPARPRPGMFTWLRTLSWIQRAAVAGVFLFAGVLAWQQHQSGRRAELARNAIQVLSVTPAPSVEILEDFEAIARLSAMPPGVDMDLLAANQ